MSQKMSDFYSDPIKGMPPGRVFDGSVVRMHIPNGRPAYDPGAWMSVMGETNCYSYALNIQDHGIARPGQILWSKDAPLELSAFRRENITERLLADGLVKIASPDLAPECSQIMAAFLLAGDDYHFYRLDVDGGWSHKIACGHVSKKDNAGKVILSPTAADRGRYNEFLGYFMVPEQGVKYCQRYALEM